MPYDPEVVRKSYDRVAEEEDRAEKKPSLRTEIPVEFINKYLKGSDVVLECGRRNVYKRYYDGAALQEGHSGGHFAQGSGTGSAQHRKRWVDRDD